MTHHCAVCDRVIGAGFLMCAAHWRQVPQPLKADVNRTWAALQRCPTRAHFFGAVRLSYFKARDAAVVAVQERLQGAEITLEGASSDHDD